MNPANPLQWQIDQQHLRLLALFHFVLGGIVFLFGCMFVSIVGLMAWAVNQSSSPGDDPPREMMVLFGAYYGALGVLALGSAIANIIAGVCLNRRRRKVFLFVNSCINCLNIPLGTILAVFTFLVLMRPSVSAEFEALAIPPSPAP